MKEKEENQHTNKIAIRILLEEYHDYPKNWWHYDREYRMIVKLLDQYIHDNFKLRAATGEEIKKIRPAAYPTAKHIFTSSTLTDQEIEQELKHKIHFSKTPKGINRDWHIGFEMAKWALSKLTTKEDKTKLTWDQIIDQYGVYNDLEDNEDTELLDEFILMLKANFLPPQINENSELRKVFKEMDDLDLANPKTK